MDDAESLTEADDTLEDDCICSKGCDHEALLVDDVWKTACDPACPIHGDSSLGTAPQMTEEEHRLLGGKFTWEPGDVVALEPSDAGFRDDDDGEDTDF
jgi:hypothetical protein